jgi:hypothetical protein
LKKMLSRSFSSPGSPKSNVVRVALVSSIAEWIVVLCGIEFIQAPWQLKRRSGRKKEIEKGKAEILDFIGSHRVFSNPAASDSKSCRTSWYVMCDGGRLMICYRIVLQQMWTINNVRHYLQLPLSTLLFYTVVQWTVCLEPWCCINKLFVSCLYAIGYHPFMETLFITYAVANFHCIKTKIQEQGKV